MLPGLVGDRYEISQMFEDPSSVWFLVFLIAFLVGSWALTLPFAGLRPFRRLGGFGGGSRSKGASYVRIDYRIPARSRNTIIKQLEDALDARSVYLRAEFLLTYAASFEPDQTLNKWLASPSWSKERGEAARLIQENLVKSVGQIRRGNLRALYEEPIEAPSRLLAMSFPLLPPKFSVFISQRVRSEFLDSAETLEQGMYMCSVVDWRDEDGYALQIEAEAVGGRTYSFDQATLMDAIRLRKAAVDSIFFLDLPIYVYAAIKRPLPALLPEQRPASKIIVGKPNARAFSILDTKLLKLLGGANPINLLRLAWFYHPVTGISQDQKKYQRLVDKAEAAGIRSS